MSIRTNPGKAVPALLNRLTKTLQTIKADGEVASAEMINKIKREINTLKDQFPAVKQWQEELLGGLAQLDRHHRNVDGKSFSSMLDVIDKDIDQIKASLSRSGLIKHGKEPMTDHTDPVPARSDAWQEHNSFKKLSELEKMTTDGLDKNRIVKCLQLSYDRLEKLERRICFLFLAIFPKNVVLKRRLLIYWWIGEGLIQTEEEGEEIFKELLKLELLIPYGNGKCPIVKKCRIHPWIRYMLIKVAKNEKLLHFDDDSGIPRFDTTNSRRACLISDREKLLIEDGSKDEVKQLKPDTLRTIFNVSGSYVSFKPGRLAELKKLVVLQLGRWQISPTHHIEVQGESFLKELRTQKHLKYLSLRGISGIAELPSSIVELVSLEILDLKACHNLERLPADIKSLRKLTHLDVSKCYLLESMPKGLDKLRSLQVLNGFIIGNSQKTPCRIDDLKYLEKLKRLSIHIGSEAFIQPKELEKLKLLESVTCLKISWGVVSNKKRKDQVLKASLSFPSSLKKLNLEGIPHQEMPKWLKPSKLMQLKKLYINGGELKSLDHDEEKGWNVEIFRLKYTKNLKIDLPRILEMFPSLKYVLKVKVRNVKGDAKKSEPEIEWSKESEGSMSQPIGK